MATLDLPDVRLNYHVVGSGTPITLIHGLGTNLSFWYLGAARMLAQRNSLLMYDLRGHGASSMPSCGYRLDAMCDDLMALHDRLGIRRSHVVGHSYGARVALAYAARHRERVETLTVADTQIRTLQPPMRLRDWPHWEGWKRNVLAGGAQSVPDDSAVIDFRLLVELGQYVGGGGAMRPARPRINLNSRQMGARGLQRWQELLSTTTADEELADESLIDEEALKKLDVPVLLVYGKLSHCVPTSEMLLRILPNSRRMLVAGAGHFFPIVKPPRFARALLSFLAVQSRSPADAIRPVAGRRRRLRARADAILSGGFASGADA